MSKNKKAPGAYVVQGSIALPPRDVLRFLENSCAGSKHGEYVDALFVLYQNRELDTLDSARFERVIKKVGAPDEKKRLEDFKAKK